jgi:quinoprotein glucose dehydrogenase
MRFFIFLVISFNLPFLGIQAVGEPIAVSEADMPALNNKQTPFRGVIKHDGYVGHTWVSYPHVENPASLGIDPQGRLFVAEANRFWFGVPDLRGAQQMTRGDFRSVTVEDRQKLYDEHISLHGPGSKDKDAAWYTKVPDRIIRLADRDGNGAADHRNLFSDHFKGSLDGIGFSVLAENDGVYFTCIPAVWKMTDANDDGVADTHERIAEGFGVRVSFIGHDLHGVIRGLDGRLYFSVGDRGYHVTTKEGKVYPGSGRGAVFRCESDGSGFEVYAKGLRNPQELAFDDHGNLFTFDNTGDIGDRARIVYLLENTDSGWDMSHQSAHHYRQILDWGEFHPAKSMWVAEQMFQPYRKDQPQWVYPPVGHVANGPSGVTWLTGDSVPEDLRGQFLLTDYRGSPSGSNTLAVKVEPKGAGFSFKGSQEIIRGIAASDVELGYDGCLYFADYGGGWSVNKNGSIQVLEPKDPALLKAGSAVAELFAKGLTGRPLAELRDLLSHPDQRVRKLSQFELVKRGAKGKAALEEMAKSVDGSLFSRLHAVWGLGQLGRQGQGSDHTLLDLLADADAEIRANAVRVVGDLRMDGSRDALLKLLGDDSKRVRSLAAIALGRVCKRGDAEAIAALYGVASQNVSDFDVVLRHSCLSALDWVGTVESAAKKSASPLVEERLLAVLFLRRQESPKLAEFLSDADQAVRIEAIRAIYDTNVLDTWVGNRLASLSAAGLPETVQRRIVAANYRKGKAKHAKRMVTLAGDAKLHKSVRQSALQGLRMWEASIDTDPVLGHYRPQVVKERSMKQLGVDLTGALRQFISRKQDSASRTFSNSLTALATKLANEVGVSLDVATLRSQVVDGEVSADVRVATLGSLAQAGEASDDAIILNLIEDGDASVRAAALHHAFDRKLDGVAELGLVAVKEGPISAARSGIAGLAKLDPVALTGIWSARDKSLRRELWLDAYLALAGARDSQVGKAVASFAAKDPLNVFSLSEVGGDPLAGEQVFRNQGACLQCHKIGSEGGVQGPDLTTVSERLKSAELLQSVITPGAVIAEGYGLSSIALRDGTALVGRLAKQTETDVQLVALDGKISNLKRAEIASISPPVSPMPPLGMTLPPRDLRDLIAFLASRTAANNAKRNETKHGEGE